MRGREQEEEMEEIKRERERERRKRERRKEGKMEVKSALNASMYIHIMTNYKCLPVMKKF